MAKKDAVRKEAAIAQDSKSSSGLSKFFQETQEELKKIVWPSRQQLISESAAVISMVILVATLIYFIDKLFAWGAGKVF